MPLLYRDNFDRVPVGLAPFTTGEWPRAKGSHRAVVRVTEAAGAVCAYLPWRRRDRHPESKHVRVEDAAGTIVDNSLVVSCNREYGEVVFEPVSGPGLYHLYYLVPSEDENADRWPRWAFPITRYQPPHCTASETWLQAHKLTRQDLRSIPQTELNWDGGPPPEADAISKLKGRVFAPSWRSLPQPEFVEFQARDAWDSFHPMELIATQDERLALESRCKSRPFICFPESRRHPIRMTDALPYVWAIRTPDQLDGLEEQADRNEYLVFQVGVYASKGTLAHLNATWTDLRGPDGSVLPATSVTCFNLEGINQVGASFRKVLHVETRQIQPLWFGVDIPANAVPGRYTGLVHVKADDVPAQAIRLVLEISDRVCADRGDGDAWRLSRLRWLNSTLSLDDDVCPPYTPVQVKGRSIRILGRRIDLDSSGLPAQITSFIDMFDIRKQGRAILAAPVQLTARTADGAVWPTIECRRVLHRPGRVVFKGTGSANGLSVAQTITVEADGCIELHAVLKAKAEIRLETLALQIQLPADVARFAVGATDQAAGGRCPDHYECPAASLPPMWIGDYNAGLGLRLPPDNNGWTNSETSRLEYAKTPSGCTIRLQSGPVGIPANGEATFVVELYPTPYKPLPRDHWAWRYYHANYGSLLDVPRGTAAGARIFTQHHETPSNPYISYPFLTADRLKAIADPIHAAGAQFKFYYTVRELSVRAPELWALRSLGDEVLVPAVGRLGYEELSELPIEYQLRDPYSHPFSGMPWMCEHLGSDYHTRWHSLNKTDALQDGSLQISGASRWSNFFVEGIRWLMENAGLDGLYFDGITFDRESLRRVRKTLTRTRPQGLIDYHGDPTVLHLLPFYDSLWFGEGADYRREPEYWFAVVSGIAFGVPGELLLPDAGVARGMVFGLCQRYGWMSLKDVDPSALWRWWDTFDIAGSRMLGYWQAECPVRTDQPNVKATAYVHAGRRMAIAVASWAEKPVTVRLDVDWKAVGLLADKVACHSPEITLFQPKVERVQLDAVPIDPGKGWLIEVNA